MTLTLDVLSVTRPDIVSRQSAPAAGAPIDPGGFQPFFSADGRSLGFLSAGALAPGDTNGDLDIYVRDLATGALKWASVPGAGAPGNGACFDGALSADGNLLIFSSTSSNLVQGDTNTAMDVFVKNFQTGALTRISTSTNNAEGNNASAGGSISADGRVAVFDSFAGNLVGGDTNGAVDVFVKNFGTGALERVSVAANGTQADGQSSFARISADGKRVFFLSDAGNLTATADATPFGVDLYEKDIETKAVRCVSTNAAGAQGNQGADLYVLSADGRYLVFASLSNNLVVGDTNDKTDIFRKDLQSGAIDRVSTAANGAEANGGSTSPSVSADGRYVTFASDSTNIVAGASNQLHIYRKDMLTGAVMLISASAAGQAANADSFRTATSSDGQRVAFDSDATNLTADANGQPDVFLVDANLVQNRIAIDELRYVEARLAVGTATSVGIAWGDGTSEQATPSNGTVRLGHAYAAAGEKAAVVTVSEGGQSWAVPYVVTTAALQMTRNTTLSDTLSGGAGNDVLTGDTFGNVLIGNAGNDTLDGQAGADRMEGGIGNDVYIVDNALDVVAETAGNGTDLVQTSIDYALRANVENLSARGAFGLSLSGNDLDNAILGGIGNDKLYGRLGKDALTGGAGKDVFVFDSAVAKKKNANIDSIVDFNVKDDTFYIDNALSKALGKGTPAKPVLLAKDKFWIGAKAHDASDRVVYNKAKGALYLDEDGSGAKAAILIATLKKGLAMTHKDFFVI